VVTYFLGTKFIKFALRKITTREIQYLVTKPGWTGKEYPAALRDWMDKIKDPAHPQYKEVQAIKKDYRKRVDALARLRLYPKKFILGDDEIVYTRFEFPKLADYEIKRHLLTYNSEKTYPAEIAKIMDHPEMNQRNGFGRHPQHDEIKAAFAQFAARTQVVRNQMREDRIKSRYIPKAGVSPSSSDIGLYSISATVDELVRYATQSMAEFMTMQGLTKRILKSEIMTIVDQELENTGRRMLYEAKRLMPAPATVPRVTVASLAGRDFSMRSERDEDTGAKVWIQNNKPVEMRKHAKGYITAALGVERTQRMVKMGYLPINLPTTKEVGAAGGARAYKKPFAAEAKRTTTLHMSNKRLHQSHVTHLDVGSTGKLRQGLFYLVTPEKDIIMGDIMPYWTDVEFGTGIRGRMNPHPSPTGRGKRVYVPRNYLPENTRANYGNFPGMRAQPFIYPAYINELRPFYYRLKKRLDIYIKNYYSYQGKLKI